MQQATAAEAVSWYRSLDRGQWRALLASNLGWLFDGFETYALILTVGLALRQLLDPSEHAQIHAYAGTVIAITLFGWGVGGVIGGVLADYVGRKRVMIYAVAAYSVTTGLSALSQDWIALAATRFLVGIAIGSEWATGASMVAELWPDRHRGKGAGLMQCGLGMGFFLASLAWLAVSPWGEDAWRYMYLIGILPALLTLWIRRGIPESALWQRTDERRRAARDRRRAGAAAMGDAGLTRFTMLELFATPAIARRTIVVFVMSLATTAGWWGISTWVPPFIGASAAAAGLSALQWASYAGIAYTAGAVAGYVCFGFLTDAFGRRPVTIAYYAIALLLTPLLFLTTRDLALLLALAAANAFFSTGQYSWMPAWLPELYPTSMRATAMAFAFNAPRFVAFLGPLLAGTLIVQFGGFGHVATFLALVYLFGIAAALFLPETRGRALPDTA